MVSQDLPTGTAWGQLLTKLFRELPDVFYRSSQNLQLADGSTETFNQEKFQIYDKKGRLMNSMKLVNPLHFISWKK